MAILSVTFDTNEKTLSVSMDGAEVTDLQELVFYKSYGEEGEYSCSLCTMTHDEENDVRQYNRLSASEAGLGPSSLAADVAAFLGGRA